MFVEYDAPDIHVSQIIVAYCQKVSEATGRVVFVIDRAVNAVALARAFEAHDMGLLCMLDDNEHKGLASFEATEVETLKDGTKVYSGPWKELRKDDPRHFVIVQPVEGKSLVYWGTPKVAETVEAREWPGVYRDRNEIQEHRFKDMIAHGALKINKQTIMTIRTLLLENRLRAFMAALLAVRQTKVSLQPVLGLLFERCGSRMETPSQVVYRVNTAGISLANRRLLREIVEGLCAMGLQERGKPIHVRLKDMPP